MERHSCPLSTITIFVFEADNGHYGAPNGHSQVLFLLSPPPNSRYSHVGRCGGIGDNGADLAIRRRCSSALPSKKAWHPMVDVIARSMSEWSTFAGLMGRNSIRMMCNCCDINVNIACSPCMHSMMSCKKRNACIACDGESFILNSTCSSYRIVNCQASCDDMVVYVIGVMNCMASLLLHDACFWRFFGCEPYWAKLECRLDQFKPNTYPSSDANANAKFVHYKILSVFCACELYAQALSRIFTPAPIRDMQRFFYRMDPVPYVTRHPVTSTCHASGCPTFTITHRI